MNLKNTVLTSMLAMTAALSSATAAFANNWVGPERSGSCTNSSTCTFGSYSKPSTATGIGGFYVNVVNASTSSTVEAATLGWTGRYCNGTTFSGSKRISENTTNQNYVDFSRGVCSFTFSISQRSMPIYFKMNYDADY